MKKKYCVLILGMHRSGTSALTKYVLDKGFSLTSKPFPPHPDDNPLGYWESRESVILNNNFMSEIGGDWKDVNPLPVNCFSSEIATQYRNRISKQLQSAFELNNQIVVKDPRLCRLLPLWLPVLNAQCDHLVTIFIFRQAETVYRSLAKRIESKDIQPGAIVDRHHAIALWLRYNIEGVFNSRKLTRMFLSYEQWLAQPSQITTGIDNFLHEELAGANLSSTRLEHKQPRHIVPAASSQHGDLNQLCDQAYRAMLEPGSTEFLNVLRENTKFRFPSYLQDELLPPPQEIIAKAQLKHLCTETPTWRVAEDIHSPFQELSERPFIFISDMLKNPCHIYRVKNMVDAINSHDGKAYWTTSEQAIQHLSALHVARMVVVHRCQWNEDIAKIYEFCRENKIAIAYDIDDLIFEPGFVASGYIHFISELPAKEQDFWIRKIKSFRKTLLASDFCITSTPSIQAHLKQQNVRAVCIPNGYSEENVTISNYWRKQQQTDKTVRRLGYASGSPTHAADFALIAETVADFLSRNNNWILTIVGNLDMSQYSGLFDESQIELRPKTQHINLAYELARFDVNLIPLERNPFCDAKSPLKWYEAALCGVPSIATSNSMYTQIFRDGESGLLASSSDDWLVQIERLANNESLRLNLAQRARIQSKEYCPARISAMFKRLH